MKRLLNIDFALVQAIYWMLYTVAGSFVSVLLLEKDYTNASIGTIIAVGSVLAILLQTVITHVTDRSSRLDSIGMIKILTLLLAAGVFAVLLIGEKSAALTIAYVGVIILHTAMHPFVNALSFKLEETGLQVNYGVGRSMGSLAAGGISFVLYGMISAIGVRNVVENRVDFTNSRNLIVAAVILVSALGFNSVGGLTFMVGSVSINLSGLAISAIVGILLNAILPGNDYEFDAADGTDAATSGNLQV